MRANRSPASLALRRARAARRASMMRTCRSAENYRLRLRGETDVAGRLAVHDVRTVTRAVPGKAHCPISAPFAGGRFSAAAAVSDGELRWFRVTRSRAR